MITFGGRIKNELFAFTLRPKAILHILLILVLAQSKAYFSTVFRMGVQSCS